MLWSVEPLYLLENEEGQIPVKGDGILTNKWFNDNPGSDKIPYAFKTQKGLDIFMKKIGAHKTASGSYETERAYDPEFCRNKSDRCVSVFYARHFSNEEVGPYISL